MYPRMKLMLPFIVFLFAFIISCDKNSPDAIWDKDRVKLEKYIADNDLDATQHESGIFYVIEQVGNGAHPTLSSRVHIRYKGKLLDDKIFDQSPDSGSTFTLANTIIGWREGVPLFRVGGKGILLIPSGLAYGQYPPYGSGIPRNACLVFDIEILDMN
jgi:FKBP-type peptidyl-prolyl cis-trans isomerase FkpA